jgi:adenylate kinase family enzyme
MTKVINLLAGPGAGKSTLAAELFAEMKWDGISCELVGEVAKELTWEGHHNVLEDQLYVSAMQNRRLQRLLGKVDYIITDSPLILCHVYMSQAYKDGFAKMMIDLWNLYDNRNYYVDRQKKYVAAGRNQTEEEARQVDERVLDALNEFGITRMNIPGVKKHGVDIIMRDLKLR